MLWTSNLKIGEVERDLLKDIGAQGRIILKWVLKHYDGMVSRAFTGLRIGISDKFLWSQYWISSGSVKGQEFIEQLIDY
jgi:hypothetical protein